MKRLIPILTLVLAFPSGAIAQNILPQAVRFHVMSWHDRGDFSNANLGAGLRWNSGLTAGGFRNSLGRPSWYGGLVVTPFERRAFQLELMAGVITGYSESSPVDLVAMPTLGWRLSPQSSLQVAVMPRFVIPANAVHLMFEQRFGSAGEHRGTVAGP